MHNSGGKLGRSQWLGVKVLGILMLRWIDLWKWVNTSASACGCDDGRHNMAPPGSFAQRFACKEELPATIYDLALSSTGSLVLEEGKEQTRIGQMHV